MLRSITFIAFLFCVGIAGLVLGGSALYGRIDLHFNGRSATMQLADPGRKITLPPPGGIDAHQLDVKYSGPDGEIVVPQMWLSRDVARRLVNGEKVSVTYLKHTPNRVFYSGEKPDSPWGLLALGIAAMATFVYAYKLKRREAG